MGILTLMDVIKEHAPGATTQVTAADLDGKMIAIDALITIYQFLSVGNGNVPSLVSGFFYRTLNLIKSGVRPVYVFDGMPPGLKEEELTKRAERRSASAAIIAASIENSNGDVRHTSRTVKLLPEHVTVCKKLLSLMGLPYVEAPGEGEAQCVELVKCGNCYAVGSEDMDVIAFGATMLRNLKLNASGDTVIQVDAKKVLTLMKLSSDEFIDLCILLGCDYVQSIQGIGRVKAFQLIQKHKTIENILRVIDKEKHPVPKDWLNRVKAVRKLFKQPKVTDARNVQLNWTPPVEAELLGYLRAHGVSDVTTKSKVELLKAKLGPLVQSTDNRGDRRPRKATVDDVATRFLLQLDLDPDNSTRFYRNELKAAYLRFQTSNPSAKSHSADAIFTYFRMKKYTFYLGSQVTIKPLYIGESEGRYQVYIVYPGVSQYDSFVACAVCERGFTTWPGLQAHRQSASHTQLVRKLLDQFTQSPSGHVCGVMGCDAMFTSLEVFQRHLNEEKGRRVDYRLPRRHAQPLGAAQGATQEVDETLDPALVCKTCGIRTNSRGNMEQHLQGKRHKLNLVREAYRTTRHTLIKNRDDVHILFDDVAADEHSPGVLTIVGVAGSSRLIKFKIVNTSKSKSVIFEACIHHTHSGVCSVVLSDAQGVTAGTSHLEITAQQSYWVHATIRPTYLGRLRVPVLFFLRRDGNNFVMSREIVYKCVANAEMFSQLQPVAPYERVKVKHATYYDIVRSELKPDIEKSYELERTLKLDQYSIPHKMSQSVRELGGGEQRESKLETLVRELGLKDCDYSSYSMFFNNLLYLEEHQMQLDIGHYTMEGVPMRKDERSSLVRLTVPGLAENRPSVLKGDRLYVTMVPPDGRKYEGHVHNVSLTELSLGFNTRLTEKFINNMKFRVEFTINRLSIKLEHRAVSWAGEHSTVLERVLFPSPQPMPPFFDIHTLKLRVMNRSVEQNAQQMDAVKHIVCGTSRPAPYLIYGPPGTGKTFTLVEAIKQVYREFPNCRILACAPQNAAADLLTARLLEHIPKADILRLNALSRSYGEIEKKVADVCNYRSKTGVVSRTIKHAFSGTAKQGDMEVFYPNKEVLKQRKILVSTLVTSGRLVSAEMTDHFTHIFIDEAGHATEPETVIPLANLLNVNMSRGGQVVLAGDPMQLGPVIRSFIASSHGLGKSLLERLMDTQVYRRDQVTGLFNQNYVTKLVRSFRSHPEILEVPNSCFYDNELQAHADELQRERFCQWEGLPTKDFPLIFHGVDGEEEQEGKSPSWFNRYEVMQVIQYVRLLSDCKKPLVKPEHIGIISPYHQQVNKIMRGLKALEAETKGRTRDYAKIKVGSVEKFQGDERDVIIISTVRSQDAYLTSDSKFNLGFVRNPKRFNVAITRAKALLIIIGNPAILRQDKNWLRLLNHIEEGGGYVGVPLPDEVDDESALDHLNEQFSALKLQEALSQDVSEGLQQGDQEWRRKE